MTAWRYLPVAALGLVFATPLAAADQAPNRVAAPTKPDTPRAIAPRAIATRAADALERGYLSIEIGKHYADMLRKNIAAGRYDALAGTALANALTADLVAVQPDNHLRVRFAPPAGIITEQAAGSTAAPSGKPAPAKPRPAVIEQPGWIAPGIAFIRFNEFPQDAAITQMTQRFMADHASAKTIIFDLRTNRGGGMDQMDVIFPQIFPRATRLVAMSERATLAAEREKDGTPEPLPASLRLVPSTADVRTFEHWVTPDKNAKLTKANIYVLTSNRTGSAGEHFAAAMKWTGRATLVGAPTAGANHFGSMRPIGDGYTLFVPEGRTYNPATGKDWEDVGIAPDIAADPIDALRLVLVQRGVKAADAARLSIAYRPAGSMQKPPLLAR